MESKEWKTGIKKLETKNLWLLTLLVVNIWVFLWKLFQQRPTDVTSFCLQFEKEDVGYWGKLSGVRESLLGDQMRHEYSPFPPPHPPRF